MFKLFEARQTEFRFTSKEQDAETGLYYYGARYYDAKLCKWISADPILEMYLPVTQNSDKAREHNIGMCQHSCRVILKKS